MLCPLKVNQSNRECSEDCSLFFRGNDCTFKVIAEELGIIRECFEDLLKEYKKIGK